MSYPYLQSVTQAISGVEAEAEKATTVSVMHRAKIRFPSTEIPTVSRTWYRFVRQTVFPVVPSTAVIYRSGAAMKIFPSAATGQTAAGERRVPALPFDHFQRSEPSRLSRQ